MEREERIKQLKAELEALEGEAKRANNIGAVALQKINDSIIRCKVNPGRTDHQDRTPANQLFELHGHESTRSGHHGEIT